MKQNPSRMTHALAQPWGKQKENQLLAVICASSCTLWVHSWMTPWGAESHHGPAGIGIYRVSSW